MSIERKNFFLMEIVGVTVIIFLTCIVFKLGIKETVYDRRPAISLGGELYFLTGYHTFESPNDGTYLGEIESSVPSTQMPDMNFQANSDIVGAPIYKIEEKIFVKIESQWWEYALE